MAPVTNYFLIWGLLIELIGGFVGLSTAYANDTFAEVKDKKVEPGKTGKIKILAGDIAISAKKVKIMYVFENTTDKAVPAEIAFMFPPFKGNEGPIFSDFSTKSDGKKIEAKIQEVQKGDEKQVVHHWTVKFEAKQQIKVEHEYAPQMVNRDGWKSNPEDAAKFCLPPSPGKEFSGKPRQAQELTYSLSTANSWRTPIQSLKITIDPLDKKVATCFPGFKEDAKKRLVFLKEGYVAGQDLTVLFYPRK